MAEAITREMVDLMLDYERLNRQTALIESQLESHQLRVAVTEARYRTGQGSTTSMIGLWQRMEDLAVRGSEKRIEQDQIKRALEILTGETDPIF
ncbi:MAG: hypothetical protein F6K31_17130 [Symploca sp. SIO2G7]|nr:hypothetical protein [Symploca sp. SIO2G7]